MSDLQAKKRFIKVRSNLLDFDDEPQTIDLIYFILTNVNDDDCAKVLDYAKGLTKEGDAG